MNANRDNGTRIRYAGKVYTRSEKSGDVTWTGFLSGVMPRDSYWYYLEERFKAEQIDHVRGEFRNGPEPG